MSIAEIGILVSWRLEKRRGEVRQAQVVARRERKAKWSTASRLFRFPSLQFWRSWVLLSRANVADIAGCVVFMGYDLRIVLGPMFHSAILLALDDMVDQRSGNVLTVPRRLGGPLLLLSHHASALSSSALRPGKQHHPRYVAPMVAASLSILSSWSLSRIHSLLSLPNRRPRLF